MIESILNLISTIFYQVLYMSVVGSIFGIIFYIIRNIFDKKISGKLKCFIWIIILLTFVIPIRFEITLEQNNESKVFSQIREFKDTSESVLMSRIESIKEFSKNEENISQNEAASFISMQEIGKDTQNEEINKKNVKDILLKKIVPYLWIIGFATFIITFIVGNRKIRSRTSKNICIDDRIDQILQEVKQELNIKRNIKVIMQDYKKVPSIFGIFNPVILITEETLKENDSTLKYIFLHELSHYKRLDLVFNYILVLVLSIHWFNPVIWVLFNKVRQDIELGADELATKRLDKNQRKEYGMTLINLIKNCTKENYTASMLCISDNEKNLERRILMIKGKTKTAIIAIIITIVVLGIVAGIVLVKFDNQKAFSHMEKLSGPGSFGLKEENEEINISSEDKQEIEEYINKICNPICVVKLEEFNDINEVSKKWIYSHLESTTTYVTEDEIKNQLKELFGNELIIDVEKDIVSSDDVVMPTYDKTAQKYALPTYGMDNVPVYSIDSIKINNNEYVANVIEYNEMSDLFESDNNHELIISTYDESIEKVWKWKEVFRVNQDTSEEDIKNEVFKRKDEFQSYNITLEKSDNNFIVKNITKNKINETSEKTENQKQVEEFEQDKKDIQEKISQIEYTNTPVNNSSNVSEKLIFPLNSEYEIVKGFGKTFRYNEETKENEEFNHTGIDLKTDEGNEILAAKGGNIVYSGYKGSYGYLIVIDHGDGMQTYYAHCSELLKEVGEQVNAGDIIAKIGSTGNSTGPHLHFEVRINGVAVNPMPYVN